MNDTRIYVHANKLRQFDHSLQEVIFVNCEVPICYWSVGYMAVSCDTAFIYEVSKVKKETEFGVAVVSEPSPYSADARPPVRKLMMLS